MGALKGISATVLTSAQTRLALLANEVQIQKHHALQQLMLALALAFCLGLGVVLAAGLAVLIWWEQRQWVLGCATLLFLGLAAYFYNALRRSTAEEAAPFAASLAELQEDLRQLKAATGHDQNPG